MGDVRRLPGPAPDHWEWRLQAACRGQDGDLFFHPEGERGSRRAARDAAAKAICRRCPVVLRCLQHALTVQEPYGIWGGLTSADRTALVGRPADGHSDAASYVAGSGADVV